MFRLLIYLLLLSALSGNVSAALKQKSKKAKQIKWNSSYYNGEFSLCKPLRMLNAVEKIKAQKASVEDFRRCGSKLLSLAAFKYKFPSFAIPNVLRIFCFMHNYLFAYIANDGGLIISPETESDYMRAIGLRYVAALSVPGNLQPVKHGKGEYVISTDLIREGLTNLFRCSLPNKLTSWVDGDVAKYSASYHEAMLL